MENDYELIYLAQEDERMKEEVYNKYKGFIYKKILQYTKNNNNIDDYLNEIILTLYQSIDSYIDYAPFISYFNKCVNNTLLNYRRKSRNKKDLILNNSVTIDSINIDEIRSINRTPEEILIDEYNYNKLREKIINSLTWKEELIFKLKEENYSVKEIGEILDNKKSTIYKIIKEVRTKIANIMSNEKK